MPNRAWDGKSSIPLPCACCGELSAAEVCPECGSPTASEMVRCPAACDHGRVTVWRIAPWLDEEEDCTRCDGEGFIEPPYAYEREVFPWLLMAGNLYLLRRGIAAQEVPA